MHDPANLDVILNLAFWGVVLWMLFAVGGAIYLGLKWLPKAGQRPPIGPLIAPLDPRAEVGDP